MAYNISEAAIYRKIYGFSWSAFFFTPYWAIANKVWVGLLSSIPFIGFLVSIIMGIYGNRLAYDKFEGDQEAFYFRKVTWGRAIFLGLLFNFLISSPFLLIKYNENKYDDAMKQEVFKVLYENELIIEEFNNEPLENLLLSESKIDIGTYTKLHYYTLQYKGKLYRVSADTRDKKLTQVSFSPWDDKNDLEVEINLKK